MKFEYEKCLVENVNQAIWNHFGKGLKSVHIHHFSLELKFMRKNPEVLFLKSINDKRELKFHGHKGLPNDLP